MANIINLKESQDWNSFQDLSEDGASPAIVTKETEARIIAFDPERRLKDMKLGATAKLAAARRLAAPKQLATSELKLAA